MVDFAKLREDQNKRMQEEEKAPAYKKDLDVINECLEANPGSWANNFLLSVKQWLRRSEDNYLSVKQADKLYEIAFELGVKRVEGESIIAPVKMNPAAKPKPLPKPELFDDMDDDIPF